MSEIIRVERKKHAFVTIDKTPLLDKRLSWKARGLLAYLFCKPDNWRVDMEHLINQSDEDGYRSVRSGLEELQKLGYLIRFQKRGDKGYFAGYETVLFETPEDASQWWEEHSKDAPEAKKEPSLQNVNTAKPFLHFRKTDNRKSENVRQIINKEDFLEENLQVITENTLPLTPSNQEGECEQPAAAAVMFVPEPEAVTVVAQVMVEAELKPTVECRNMELAEKDTPSKNKPEATAQPNDSARDQLSAAAGACGKFDNSFKARSGLPNYRTNWSKDGIKREFLIWLAMRIMSDWSPYKSKTPTAHDAWNWVKNKEREGLHEIVENRYSQLQAERDQPEVAALFNSRNAVKAAQTADIIQKGMELSKNKKGFFS